jgi:RNA polymerase-binding transcription factor DksA
MIETSKRYSDRDLAEFKTLINDKITSAKKDLKRLRDSITQGAGNGTNDTYSAFKAFEEGSETLSKESNSILAQRQEKFIRDLNNAIIRIENKTYGICRVTGKLINKERLKLVPHATLSIEAKMQKNNK